MMGLKMFGNDYTVNDSDIIKELKKIKQGEPLPREGIFSYLYEYVTYAGQTVVLQGKKSPLILQVEHDDILADLSMDEYTWHLESDDKLVSLTLLIKDSQAYHALPFSFKKSDRKAEATLRSIRSKKKIEICFLSILYGDIIREENLTFRIPGALASQM